MNPIRRTRPIPADGLERALRDGRHRQRKAAAFAGAPALSLVVALVLVLQGGSGGKDSLDTLNDPEGTSTATAEPTATQTSNPGESTGPAAEPEASAEPSTEPTSEVDCEYIEDCSGDGEDEETPVVQRGVVRYPFTDSHSTEPKTDTRCQSMQQIGNENFYLLCVSATVSKAEIRVGEVTTLTYKACRTLDGRTDDLTFHWTTGQEHEAYVTTRDDGKGPRLWQWSADKAFTGGAHEDTIRQQACFVWTADWDGYDSLGEPVPAGPYYLSGYELEDPSSPDYNTPGYGFGHILVNVVDN